MAHNYLLEIGIEEIPAHVVTPSINQLKERFEDFLKTSHLAYKSIDQFSTPRRLAIRINGLDEQQPDTEVDAKGPAKKIALDQDGNWTKAAIGFTRGQGVTVDDITFKDIKGTEYVYIHKKVKGESTEKLLGENVAKIIMAMNFPTMMKWADFDFKFVRPIRWIVSLLDTKVIPVQILDVTADRITNGHRFLGQSVSLADALDYEDALKEQFVIVNAQVRKDLILSQINSIAEAKHWSVQPDANLVEEVNNLVEWPTAFSGSFDTEYLKIPEEVLITSMRDHQRFFFARDDENKLLPVFISVRNGNEAFIDNVVRGNEKVLTARLEDAKFFFEEDQNQTIDQYVNRLKKVSFHDKISSMFEKMLRVQIIAKIIGEEVGLEATELKDLNRAAGIYKFDLVTGMVGEFPELQGVMGEKYALIQGETPVVAQAVREHYMPISSDGALPASVVGSVLSLADKFDNLFSFFAKDMIPTGSNDPYALRRNATGIIRILAENHWNLSISDLQIAVETDFKQADFDKPVDVAHNAIEVRNFLKDRIRVILENNQINFDVIDTVLSGTNEKVLDIIDVAEIFQNTTRDAKFKNDIEALTRVLRITTKNSIKDPKVETDLFENATENDLYNEVVRVSTDFDQLDNQAKINQLMDLESIITAFFDATMVMDKNELVKNNRLSILQLLSDKVLLIGDLTKLVIK